MKKYIIGLVAAMAVMSPACDTLDFDPTGQYSDATAYSSIKNLDLYVKDMYTIYHNIANVECGSSLNMLEDAWSDLIKTSWYGVGQSQNKFFSQENSMSVETNPRSNWSTMYTHIRKFNYLLVDAKAGKLSKLPQDEVAARVAEVRFLRAFAYQELAKFHGGVILRVSEDKVDDQNENAKARASKEETWDFILGEYDKAIADLPESWSTGDYGRITKQGAQAMKARAALYAGRWDAAYTAADNVIKSNKFQLSNNLGDIYTNSNNSELIIPVLYELGVKQHNFDSYLCPPSFADAKGYKDQYGAAATPTEEYVSQFDIKVGNNWESFDWNNLAKYGNEPFKNRDPRFYQSILANGSTFQGNEIQCWEGGTDQCMKYAMTGQDNVHRSTTGYYIRKFLSSKTGTSGYNFVNNLSDQHWIEMRLAEVYLIRSEAAARQNKWAEAYNDLNVIRNRATLPNKPQKNSWEEYLVDLQKERICELGLEGHRYDDIMRWGISQEVLNGKRTHGVWVTKNNDGSFSYEIIEADDYDRIFPKKYEIFPIPYNEIQNNPLCDQNEAWK
ncbi:MAG: RagB/SusD family nutrient uptake outer membrane protein [Muribaculaceae bacterium]|nr:RagB/SusD family nutrient uptake outer membrane protein [Muribaculaceae bacterium]